MGNDEPSAKLVHTVHHPRQSAAGMQLCAADAVVTDVQPPLAERDRDRIRTPVADRVAERLARNGGKGTCAPQIVRQAACDREPYAESSVGVRHIGKQGCGMGLLRERNGLQEAVITTQMV